MTFRYDINALRALAVIGVILYHFQIPYVDGGFAGVDVFFVISGYLMSRIIFTSIEKGDFSFIEFYWKRAKRIIPALLCLIIVFSLLGFFFYFPNDYMLNQKNAASSVLFLSNFLYWKNTNYFLQSNDNIFLHTWSLSVEWQFYIVYPVLLFFLNKMLKSKRQLLYLFCLITLLAVVFSLVFGFYRKNTTFYLLPTRAWEMMVGGIAFLVEGYLKDLKYKNVIAFGGYALILLSFGVMNNQMVWPGVFTLIPVFATFLVIVSGFNELSILKHKLVQFTGSISYSLYLWHWPVYIFAMYLGLQINNGTILGMMMISVLLAILSFKYIESARFSKIQIVVFATVVLAGCAGLSCISANNFMFKPKALKLAMYAKDYKPIAEKTFRKDVCFISDEKGAPDLNKAVCLAIIKDKKNVLLIGDSHAAEVYSSLQEILKDQNINILQASASNCFPIAQSVGEQHCKDMMTYVYDDFIKNNFTSIDGVILSCNWMQHITGEDDNNWKELLSAIAYYKHKNIGVLIIGQNETYRIPYPTIAAKEYQYSKHVGQNYIVKSSETTNVFLKEHLKPYYIDIYNADAGPKLSEQDDPYMFDRNHFTKYGADIAVDRILANPVTKQFIRAMGM
jgi:peptidoglycan/LPS O-acetylase OafA/YrhL